MNLNFTFDKSKVIDHEIETTRYDKEPHTYLSIGYFTDEDGDSYYLEIAHNMETDQFGWFAYYEDEFGDSYGAYPEGTPNFEIDSAEYDKAKYYIREIEHAG